MTLPLRNCSILNTRPQAQSAELTATLERLGAKVIQFPVFDIEPINIDLAKANTTLQSATKVFFTSTHAATCLTQQLDKATQSKLKEKDVYAVGKGTQSTLQAFGCKNISLPAKGAGSEVLMLLPDLQALANNDCLIVTGKQSRSLLQDELTARGAKCQILEVYQRVPITETHSLLQLLETENPTYALASSIAALENLHQLLSKSESNWLQSTVVVVVSDRIAQRASELAVQNIIQAKSALPDDIATAMIHHYAN